MKLSLPAAYLEGSERRVDGGERGGADVTRRYVCDPGKGVDVSPRREAVVPPVKGAASVFPTSPFHFSPNHFFLSFRHNFKQASIPNIP